jgi:hypothetical protein
MSQKLIISIIAIVFLQGCESIPDVRHLVRFQYTPYHQLNEGHLQDKFIFIQMSSKMAGSELMLKTFKDTVSNALTTNGLKVTDDMKLAQVMLYLYYDHDIKAKMIGDYDYGFHANGWRVSGTLYDYKQMRMTLSKLDYKIENENKDNKLSDSAICEFKGSILAPMGIDSTTILEHYILFISKDFMSISGKTRDILISEKIFN